MATLVFASLASCASVPASVSRVPPAAPRHVELIDVPFFPQERYQCGPAALATVLNYSGVPTLPESLVERVYLPERRGSLQVEMLAASRSGGRLPYVIDASIDALLEELKAGRPVLVLQNLGVRWIPRWHYAVVVGIDLDRQQVILRSGTDERRVTNLKLFLRTWQRSGFWGFVALPPGSLPANPDRERYLQSVADLEATGQTASALRGWQAALERWPEDPIALFGLGNAQLELGDSSAAEIAYRELLRDQPGNALAMNNLAYALARQGRHVESKQALMDAIDATSDPATRAMLRSSLTDLHR